MMYQFSKASLAFLPIIIIKWGSCALVCVEVRRQPWSQFSVFIFTRVLGIKPRLSGLHQAAAKTFIHWAILATQFNSI